jgi:hypothetical protein
MPEGQMINFRMKPSEIRVLDEAATAAGLTRSDFIRKAVWVAIHSYVPGAAEKPKCQFGDPKECPVAQWTKVGTRKVCRTCGTYR